MLIKSRHPINLFTLKFSLYSPTDQIIKKTPISSVNDQYSLKIQLKYS